jgi:hypothetical protein
MKPFNLGMMYIICDGGIFPCKAFNTHLLVWWDRRHILSGESTLTYNRQANPTISAANISFLSWHNVQCTKSPHNFIPIS